MLNSKSKETTIVFIIDWGYFILKSSSNTILLIFPIIFGDFYKVSLSEMDACTRLKQ